MGAGGLGVAMQDPNGVPFGITHTSNHLDVVLNDSVTPTLITHFNRVTNSTTLAVQVEVDQNEITVTSPTGISIGSYIILFNPSTERFSFYHCTAILGSVVTLDGWTDTMYPVGTYVDVAITNMAVDGSGTRQIFGLRGIGAPPGVDIKVDITRIIIECHTTAVGDLGDFGDIAGGVANGLFLRRHDGTFQNIFNVKTNGELAGVTMDYEPYVATNPNQGVNGFISRLTFSGQDKLGVVIRLPVGEDLEFVLSDNFSTLVKLEVIAEGSLVDDYPVIEEV